MFKLSRYLKLYKKEVIIGPAAKLTEAVFELLVPFIMSRMIDIGIGNRDKSYIIKTGILLVALGILGLSFALICQYFASKASQGIGTALRNDLFGHILSLSSEDIDKIGSSALVTRLNSDINQLQLAVAMLIRLAVRAPFLIIGSTVAAMLIDLKLSVIFIVTAPLLAFVLYEIMKHSVPFFRSIQKKTERISLLTKEGLSGARVIRAFSRQKYEENRFAETADGLADISMKAGRISSLLAPLTFLIMNTAVIFILWFGGKRVYTGDLTQGEIVAFISYITQIMLTMVVLANITVIFTKASASAGRVNEIFGMKPSVAQATFEEKAFDKNAPAVEFRNVSFSYNKNGEYALENISFAINKGEKIGIIGSTGSGKTTLLSLIPRFYDAVCGEVLVNGINVKELSFSQLRSTVATAEQKAVILSGTVRDNINLSGKSISDNEIYDALEISQIRDFFENSGEGLDYCIEQGGYNLSGGQKQRISIARAVAAKPEILILDDSTSALDFKTESNLKNAVMTAFKDSTVIISTQRVGSIMHCDRIFVLDDGKIKGIGTHTELFENCEEYREIYLSQIKEKEGRK